MLMNCSVRQKRTKGSQWYWRLDWQQSARVSQLLAFLCNTSPTTHSCPHVHTRLQKEIIQKGLITSGIIEKTRCDQTLRLLRAWIPSQPHLRTADEGSFPLYALKNVIKFCWLFFFVNSTKTKWIFSIVRIWSGWFDPFQFKPEPTLWLQKFWPILIRMFSSRGLS